MHPRPRFNPRTTNPGLTAIPSTPAQPPNPELRFNPYTLNTGSTFYPQMRVQTPTPQPPTWGQPPISVPCILILDHSSVNLTPSSAVGFDPVCLSPLIRVPTSLIQKPQDGSRNPPPEPCMLHLLPQLLNPDRQSHAPCFLNPMP